MKPCQQPLLVPPPLHEGSRVALCATARAVTPDEMAPAVDMLRQWGLEVVVPDGLYERDGQLAGPDAHRAALLSAALGDPTIDAVLCCRGGYGTVRIVDSVDFSLLRDHPKWVVGYSDVTVLHSHLHACCRMATLHATMPINFTPEPSPATDSLREALFGRPLDLRWQAPLVAGGPFALERVQVVGGNLSILYSLLGSASQVDTRGKVLLIEDLDEYLYHIDRMMQALRRAGMLDGLAALLVGGLTDMHDNTVPFGRTAEQIVLEATEGMGFPVVLGAPIGHLGPRNRALPLGVEINFSCDSRKNCRIFAPDLCS